MSRRPYWESVVASSRDCGAETIAQRLASHVVRTELEDIPRDAVKAAKRVMLDTIGVAWAAADTPGSQPVRDLAVREGGSPDATLFAFGDRVPAAAAALVNGTLAGALDFDCLHEPSVMHCDIVILPAVMALAERQRCSGRSFLAALTLGNDLACRLGMATTKHAGWFYSSLHGGFAAAAVAAKLLGLDESGIRNAIGIVLSTTGGTRQPILERSFTKRMQTAFAAQSGVQAALLAQCGVTGPAAVFEGVAGLYAKYEEGDPAVVLDGLGKIYENARISIKKYPSCACNHAAIEAALAIVREHDLSADDVRAVQVIVTPYMDQLVGGRFAPGDTPQVDAQFSVVYSVASAILRRRLGVEEILPPAIFDPRIATLAERISVRVDEGAATRLTPAEVVVETTDGRRLRRREDRIPGTPEAPMGDDEIEAKFRACVSRGARAPDEAGAQALIDRVASLEDLDDMSRFFGGIIA